MCLFAIISKLYLLPTVKQLKPMNSGVSLSQKRQFKDNNQ